MENILLLLEYMFFLKIIRQIIVVILYDNYKFYRIKILSKGFIDGIKGKKGKTIEIDKYY